MPIGSDTAMHRSKTPVVLTWLLLSFVLLSVSCASKEPVTTETLRHALDKTRMGRSEDAIEDIREMVARAGPGMEVQVNLAVGNLLLRNDDPSSAISHLELAASRDTNLKPYASLLLAEALAASGEDVERGLALTSELSSGRRKDLLDQRAHYLMVRFAGNDGDISRCVNAAEGYLEEYPNGRWNDEVRWLLARTLLMRDDISQAYRVCGEIWYGSPSSPYAVDAYNTMTELRDRYALPRLGMSQSEHLDFIRRLGPTGRHAHVVKEMESFSEKYGNSAHLAEVLYLGGVSAYAIRDNEKSVSVAGRLERAYPSSEWTPKSMLYAIKSLRREGHTPSIRDWCLRLSGKYPGCYEADDSLYNLATYLMNMGLKDSGSAEGKRMLAESRSLFDSLIQSSEHDGIVTDSLWKRSWLQARTGNRGDALLTLEELNSRHPDTGYCSAALYWIGKLSLETGDRRKALSSWTTVVTEEPWSYYGHRSQDMLSSLDVKLPPLGSDTPFPAFDRLDRPRESYHYDTAVELVGVGLYDFAEDELEAEPNDNNDAARLFAVAYLRALAGDLRGAVSLLTRDFLDFKNSGGPSVPDIYWKIMYPLCYQSVIQGEAERLHLDKWAIYALIRNESFFDANAVSSAGAVGLMQILPSTAAGIASSMGIPEPTESDLCDPILSVRLGTYALSNLLEQFDGDLLLALCSYNAGVSPVSSWARENTVDDLDEWIECIPYVATRLYIKKIISDMQEYRRIYA